MGSLYILKIWIFDIYNDWRYGKGKTCVTCRRYSRVVSLKEVIFVCRINGIPHQVHEIKTDCERWEGAEKE